MGARAARERELLQQIDVHGPMAAGAEQMDTADAIVVEASSPGFSPVRVSIPVSADSATAGVMAAAQASAGQPVNFFASSSEPADVLVV